MYKLIRPILFQGEAETVHERILKIGKMLSRPWVRKLLASCYGFDDTRLRQKAFGLEFKNPVGLAAGFDKNGILLEIASSLGFGFIEVGTVTPRPQEGNPKPRLFRLPKDEALINRMGFNNEGAEAVAKRLKNRPKNIIVGVNIGKNKATPNEKAVDDYEYCFRVVAQYADYIAVNVSSPNTPGLRELQDKKPLAAILKRLQKARTVRAWTNHRRVPILLKIAPDLANAQLDDIIEIVKKTKIDGVIATNTTIARERLKTAKQKVEEMGEGGLSGKPLEKRSTDVIRYLHKTSNGAFPIIGAGGIFSAKDAYEKLKAGASLVQIYTGLIYEGPGLVKRLNEGLIKFYDHPYQKT